MVPTANLNVTARNSCNNWTCCPCKRKAPLAQPESPVSQVVDTVERVHAVYHQHAPPQIQIMRVETRTPVTTESLQGRITMTSPDS